MNKELLPPKLYYSITEVSDATDLKPHILRYWETEFPILRPKKNRAGNRAYREKDISHIMLIKKLLYEEGYTIEGAKRRLRALKVSGELDALPATPLPAVKPEPARAPSVFPEHPPTIEFQHVPPPARLTRSELIEELRQDIQDCLEIIGVIDLDEG